MTVQTPSEISSPPEKQERQRPRIVIGVVIVLSGLSIWKPVQLQWLTALFGGYDVARYVHFICLSAIVAFLTVHVALALLVPKSLRAMIIGR